ncbi:MAG: c-type cytochrome [Gallionella sp.]|nr:c-type cytochrome [Gallionella sp.]
MKKQIIAGIVITLAAAVMTPAYADVDEVAAKSLAKKSDCFKCHAVDKTKKGPSYKKIAIKYKGKADAESVLVKQITTGPKVKLEDGSEESHKIIDSQDQGAIKNLVGWILSL